MSEWNAPIAARMLRDGSVVSSWETAVRNEVPELAGLDGEELRAHVGELVGRLADWIEGRGDGSTTFATAEAHAVTRLRRGIKVSAMLSEYAQLRSCVHAALEPLAPLTRVDQVLDSATAHAVEHYVRQRDEQRERFIGMLAHDLRTPLSCVSMASELLIAGQHWPPQRPMLQQILEAAERMDRMVTDVLAFARGHVGNGVPVALREHDLGELVLAVVEEMRLIYGDATIVAEIVQDLRGHFDADRVHQLIGNLLRNAIEHGDGPAVVQAFSETTSLVLVVRNRASAPSALDSAGRRKRTSHTRGLGLYIVDQIARAHGAHVLLSATHDETAVTVRWPKPFMTRHHEGM